MKKLLTLLWIIIIAGAAFFVYDYIRTTKPAVEEEQNKTTKSQEISKTPLQEATEHDVNKVKTTSKVIQEGDLAYVNGDYEQAITLYKQALTTNPNSIECLYKIGASYLADNKPEEARRYLLQLEDMQKNLQVEILIGRTYLNDRKIEDAKAYFDKIDAATADTTASSDTTLAPTSGSANTNEEVRYYKALIKILYKKHDEAKADLKSLSETQGLFDEKIKTKVKIFLDAYKTFDVYSDEVKSQHLETVLAKAFIDTGEFAVSIPLLYDVIKMQNNYRDAWIMLGYSYMQINKTADAIDAFLQAKTLDPEKPQTLFFLGIAYAIQEKFDDAIFYLEKSFKAGFEPKSIINQKLADIYLLKGNFEKALKSYTDIIDLVIADLSIYTKAVWVCIEKIDKPQRALGIADKAIAANPDAAMGYNLRGWAYVAYGDYIKAEADLLKAISIDPKLDSAYLNLGQMYEKQGMNERAVEYYKKAYELGNGDSISSLAAVKFNKLITSPSWNSSQQ